MTTSLTDRILNITRQLKWRIIAGHMLVVIVGVLALTLMSEFLILRVSPDDLRPYVQALADANTPVAVDEATTQLLETFYRDALFRSLLIAAASAVVAGLLTSAFLAREILRPLTQIATSSQRITEGRYSERVTVPSSTELAAVATNFNQMAEALEHVEQARVALISNVMHELRTPLAGLEGYLEGLIDGLFTKEPETFAQMSQEVARLKRLVNDLQALSKVEAGQIALHIDVFDLTPLLARVVSQLRPQAVAQCLELVHTSDQPQVMVCADPDRTAQILVNMLGNAIRYTPEDGCITITCASVGHSVEVSVQDTGIGIPAEALPYIFERFYRVDRSRARRSGGSGIGLTISRHLAWAMGGDLTAASPGEGQGSTFILTLPAAR